MPVAPEASPGGPRTAHSSSHILALTPPSLRQSLVHRLPEGIRQGMAQLAQLRCTVFSAFCRDEKVAGNAQCRKLHNVED
mmetsp:Transcript_18493/g.46087  ORF Transcript_18493/g.46087 Transcript_18493/m.46087 type:complete len:80 (+) Transcript_18493:76-315(+)